MSRRFPCFAFAMALIVVAGCSTAPPKPEIPQPVYVPRPTASPTGSIYYAGYDVRLFEDIRARRVGDTLTVKLTERTAASKSANTNVNKSSDVEIAAPVIFGQTPKINGMPLSTSIEGERDFEGGGASDQSNRLTGDITVSIVDVKPNGNLVVAGQKRITLNQGDEYIQLLGEVRPMDIDPDNSVLSTRVANAEITYQGRGAIADANMLGWLARFFVSALLPF